jgi:hypothetical protein
VDSFVTLTYAMHMHAIKDKTNVIQTYMSRCIARIKSTLVKFEPTASLLMMSPTASLEEHEDHHL